jgi:hypothetical protein
VLAVALVLSLRVLWNLATGTVDVTTGLVEILVALVVAWMGSALVKAAIVAYMPEPELPELEPWPASRGEAADAGPGPETGNGYGRFADGVETGNDRPHETGQSQGDRADTRPS